MSSVSPCSFLLYYIRWNLEVRKLQMRLNINGMESVLHCRHIYIWEQKNARSLSKNGCDAACCALQADKTLNGGLELCSSNSLLCLLAIVQLPGTEEKELRALTTWQRAWPDSGSVCEGFRGSRHPLPPSLPLHSAPHLKALVMHSSSPATSRLIQFPRQWHRVKFHLHLRVSV